jgi:predicted Zn finger-like uncharacterized protein
MSIVRCTCPECEAVLKVTAPADGKTVKCPRCGARFRADDERSPAPKKAADGVTPRRKAAPRDVDEDEAEAVSPRPKAKRKDEDTPPPRRKKGKAGRAEKRGGVSAGVLIGGVAGGVLLLAGIVVAVVLAFRSPADRDKVAQNPPVPPRPVRLALPVREP